MALRTQRLVALILTWIFAVIGFSTGINARVKTDQNKSFVQSHVPIPGTIVSINTHTLDIPGDILVTGCAGLAFFSSLFILIHLIFPSPTSHSHSIAKRTTSRGFETLEGAVLLFWTTWTAASGAATLAIARTKSAVVSATLNGTPLPQSFIDQEAKALGQNPAYWAQSYVRLFTIIIWPAVLFGLLATLLTFIAASRPSTRTDSMDGPMTSNGMTGGMGMKERGMGGMGQEGSVRSEKIDEGKGSSEASERV
ncbi:hypothetical protein SISSUDRAFT_1048648 [Sistotremastrum suecicum HHB10207 ss-3]|uniref:Uncharacterized protein n=1 Tax=Sistotremastrum suecicum HHB10207 ss-3 TaxID=1314776 RepID=A0A166CD52_9AGAM|nr:hypothetical protein SISSUDRAFT_1048648 [Sistotremastrum suecicum HHB10207 ss-3]